MITIITRMITYNNKTWLWSFILREKEITGTPGGPRYVWSKWIEMKIGLGDYAASCSNEISLA